MILLPQAAEVTRSEAPQWVDFGRDAHRRKLWLRIQRDPRTDVGTLLEFFADGRLVKSKRTGLDLFMD